MEMVKGAAGDLDSFDEALQVFLVGAVFGCAGVEVVEVDLGLFEGVGGAESYCAGFVAGVRFEGVAAEAVVVFDGVVAPPRMRG